MELWVSIVCLFLISLGITARNESFKKRAISDAQDSTQVSNSTAQQRQPDFLGRNVADFQKHSPGDTYFATLPKNSSKAGPQKHGSHGTYVTDLQTRLSWEDSYEDVAMISRTAGQQRDVLEIAAGSLQRPTTSVIAPGTFPPGEPTLATRKCGEYKNMNDYQPDDDCIEKDKKFLTLADCQVKPGYNYEFSSVSKTVYLHMCPKLQCWYYTQSCPRNWQIRYKGAFVVSCNPKTGIGIRWHYLLQGLEMNTLYDLQSNIFDANKVEWTLPLLRINTCNKPEPIPNLRVKAYGLGWIYFMWRRPLENCYAKICYDEQYTVEDFPGNFSQNDLASYRLRDNYTWFIKFHPCPQYPSWFCFIISENVVPFKKITFQVRSNRFKGNEDDDTSGWTTIEFTTDDVGLGFPYCPKVNVFLTLWFLIFLIVLLLILLIVAAILIALIYKVKKELERLEDEPDYEEEKIPPSNIFEQLWERLRNFFNELCPTPKKPPPPPPPPPPKPKPPKKPKPKRKPPPKPKPKPKPKSPSPPPPPPPPPPRKKEESPPPPPPPPPGPRAKKDRRGARAETKGRDAAVMDTKRMASGVGGVRARRR